MEGIHTYINKHILSYQTKHAPTLMWGGVYITLERTTYITDEERGIHTGRHTTIENSQHKEIHNTQYIHKDIKHELHQ